MKRRAFLAGTASALTLRQAQAAFDIFNVNAAPSAGAASITSVVASPSSGTFGSGQLITLTVSFTQSVTVTGTPLLTLNTAPTESASYASGSGSSALVFNYTVGGSDTANPLAVTAANLNGGSISNVNGAANLTGAPTTFAGLIISNGLPVGLIQSTPLGGGAFVALLNRSSPGPALNADGTTTGWSTGPGTSGSNNGTEIQIWWNCPASQFYQFVIPSYCASVQAAPANGLMIWLDQIPLPADGASSVANNWFCQIVSNLSPVSSAYSFTAPVTAGLHSIVIWLCNVSNGNQSGIHSDRLNIIGTGNPLPNEPSTLPLRNMINQPYSSYHFFNTPFGSSATWLALSNAKAQQVNGTGGNGAGIATNAASFSTPVWLGQTTDPVWSAATPDNFNAPTAPINTPYPVRMPAGSSPSVDNNGVNFADSNFAAIDTTNARYIYGGIEVAVQNRIASYGNMIVMDQYNLNHAMPQSAGDLPGVIRVSDLNAGVISHRILGGLAKAPNGNSGLGGYGIGTQTSQWTGMPWPGCQSDNLPLGSFLNNPNGVTYGSTIGIPPTEVKPGGLNAATSMLWDALQNYGIFLNVSVGSYPNTTIYFEQAAAGHPMMTGMVFSSVIPHLSVMSNPGPITVGQGFGGGTPRVALAPGIQQGFPSIGQSPFSFPSSPVGIPIQVASPAPFLLTSSGSAAGRKSLGTTVPIGSCVIAVLCFDRIPIGSPVNFSSFSDGRGNTYTLVQPPGSPLTEHGTLAICPSTVATIPSGQGFTAAFTPTGTVFWYSLGVYYRPPPPSGSTSIRVQNSAATASATTLSTSLAGVQTGDLIVGVAFAGNINSTSVLIYANVFDPAGMGALLNNGSFFTTSFQYATSSGTFTYTPTWTPTAPGSVAAVALANVNVAT